MHSITRISAAALVGVSVVLAPLANAAPQCDQTVGESVDAYLKRHPDVKNTLSNRGKQEDPGAPDPVLSYLERHPDVRQALITLSQQCV